MKNTNIKLILLIGDIKSNNNLKPIIGQAGISYKKFEEDFNLLTKNLPNWLINLDIIVLNNLNKSFKILFKNFNIKFFVYQYIYYYYSNSDDNIIITIKDFICIYNTYIYCNEFFLKKKINKEEVFFCLIGVLKTFNFKLNVFNEIIKEK